MIKIRKGDTVKHLADILVSEGFPMPALEYRFHASRAWRFDLAYPEQMLAIEIEGGIYSGGRHVRGVGYHKDMGKYNTAALNGWTVLRYATEEVEKPENRKNILQAVLGVFSNIRPHPEFDNTILRHRTKKQLKNPPVSYFEKS